MPSVGCTPTIPAIKQLQTYTLHHMATRISLFFLIPNRIKELTDIKW
jgi:hypothetical protein